MIAVAIASVPCTISGEIAFGRMCEDRIVRRGTPTDRAARTKSVSRWARTEPRSSRAKIGMFDDADRDHDLLEARAEHRDDPDREQQARDREHHVHRAHDHRVDAPPK